MALKQEVLAQIKLCGHISIARLMNIALNSCANSYYRSNEQIGLDFITAPQISQLFAEMVALWVVLRWQHQGEGKVVLAELGPGNGTLMFGVLRTIAKISPKLFSSIDKIVLLEINPYYVALQKKALQNFPLHIHHISDIEGLEPGKTIFIANEFFDALPIHQYIKQDGAWREVVVRSKAENLYFVDIASDAKFPQHTNASQGAILETSPSSISAVSRLANFIAKWGGAGLFIDYGYYIAPSVRLHNQYTSTLQAIKEHKFVSVLEDLGCADLTAHVDFFGLAQTAAQLGCSFNVSSQAQFLHQLGISHRAKNLATANPELAEAIGQQYQYLVDKMGQLFLVLELFPSVNSKSYSQI